MSRIHRCMGTLLGAAWLITAGAGIATAEIPPFGADGNSGNVGIGGANVGPIGVEGITAGPGGASVGGYDFGGPGGFPGFG